MLRSASSAFAVIALLARAASAAGMESEPGDPPSAMEAAAAGAGAPTNPPHVAPPTPLNYDPAFQLRAKRMDATLARIAESHGSTGLGWLQVVVGAGWVAIGAWLAVSDDNDLGTGAGRAIGIAGAAFLGAPSLLVGIRNIVGVTTTDEKRLDRFRKDRAVGVVNEITLARYEGELRAEADVARQRRHASGWLGAGIVLGGSVTIGLGAASELSGVGRTAAYTAGGSLVLLGAVSMVEGFSTTSANEREWQRYLQESARDVAVILAPTMGPRHAGVSVVIQGY